MRMKPANGAAVSAIFHNVWKTVPPPSVCEKTVIIPVTEGFMVFVSTSKPHRPTWTTWYRCKALKPVVLREDPRH